MKPEKNELDNLALFFFLVDGSHGFWHARMCIRQAFQNDETGKTYYSLPHAKWANSFGVNSQADSDCRKWYAVKPTIEISPNHFESEVRIMKRIRDNTAKYLSNNPRPQTFGQYAFMIAKAMGIKTIIFDRSNSGRAEYDAYNLVDAVWQIDRRIQEKIPHLTEPIDFY